MSNEKIIIELERMIEEQKSFLDEVCMQLKNLASNLPSQDDNLLTQIVECGTAIKRRTNRLDFLRDVRTEVKFNKNISDAIYSILYNYPKSNLWKIGMELLIHFQNLEK